MNYLKEIKNKDLFVKDHLDELQGKKVFLRIDTNSAVVDGKVDVDSYKVFAHSGTLKKYVDNGLLPILVSHQGRKGDEDFVPSLKPIAEKMEELSGVKVKYVDGVMGKKVCDSIKKLKSGEALMIKNIRDHPDETLENIAEMTKSPLTKFFCNEVNAFINDGLSVCHRNQLSVVGFYGLMPYFYGLLLESEIQPLEEVKNELANGKEVTFFVGGKKFEKINYLEKILQYPGARFLTGGLVGQYIAYADGLEMNEENIKLLDEAEIANAKKLMDKFKGKIFYPVDYILDDGSIVNRDELTSSHGVVMDVGPETLDFYSNSINGRSIFAGVMGVFEKGFSNTLELMRKVAGPNTLDLGGHSSACLFRDHGIYQYFIDKGGKVLTAGGAALSILAGDKMPGLEICLSCK
jgi:phosphoglycerate kinase